MLGHPAERDRGRVGSSGREQRLDPEQVTVTDRWAEQEKRRAYPMRRTGSPTMSADHVVVSLTDPENGASTVTQQPPKSSSLQA